MIDITVYPLINPNPVPSKGNSPSSKQRTLKGKIVSIRKGRRAKRRIGSYTQKTISDERRVKRERRGLELNQDSQTAKFLLCRVENTENEIKGKEIIIRIVD